MVPFEYEETITSAGKRNVIKEPSRGGCEKEQPPQSPYGTLPNGEE